MSHEHHGISIPWQITELVVQQFVQSNKTTSKFYITGSLWVESTSQLVVQQFVQSNKPTSKFYITGSLWGESTSQLVVQQFVQSNKPTLKFYITGSLWGESTSQLVVQQFVQSNKPTSKFYITGSLRGEPPVSWLFNSLFSQTRQHQTSALLAIVRGIHQSLVDSPHKGPVMQKVLTCPDYILRGVDYF